MDTMIFETGSVPVSIAAKVYGKDPSWIRAGIINGMLPIGSATRNGKSITDISQMNSKLGRINYYISPKKLWEETGYLWKGNDEMTNYMDKHRYYELKHFCLQYDTWMELYSEANQKLTSGNTVQIKRSKQPDRDTERVAEKKMYYSHRIHLVNSVAEKTSSKYSNYILLAVTKGKTYEQIVTDGSMSKKEFNQLIMIFFRTLNERRS